jgi:hypothetical protein
MRAMEIEEAANKRFFITAGYFNNQQVAEVIRKNYPEYAEISFLRRVRRAENFQKTVYWVMTIEGPSIF